MITNTTINAAIDYIMNHLEENISINDVAEYCGYSKFYFGRVFKEQTGESIYAFIKRTKLEQCAFRLKTEQHRTITEISGDYGYTSSNFSTAFKEIKHTSPVYFRKDIMKKSIEHPFFHSGTKELESFEVCNSKITIETLPDYFVLFERIIGNYHNLSKDWCDFLGKYHEYYTDQSLLFERTYDDPSITDVDSCIYDICMSISPECNLDNTMTIQGGKFAVYHFQGESKDIFAAYQSVFNVWLPQTGNLIDNRYSFDLYREIRDDSPIMKIDFCIPIR